MNKKHVISKILFSSTMASTIGISTLSSCSSSNNNPDIEYVEIPEDKLIIETEGDEVILTGVDVDFAENLPITVNTLLIPAKVTIIGDSALNFVLTQQTGNKYVVFAEGSKCKTIGYKAFYGCDGIKTITQIPATLSRIEESAFEGCSSLTEFVIDNQYEYIGNAAFFNSGLQKIDFSNLTKEHYEQCEFNFGDKIDVNLEVFGACSSLFDITVPWWWDKSYLSFDEFSSSINLTLSTNELSTLNMPIPYQAYNGLSNLKEITIDGEPEVEIKDEHVGEVFIGCYNIDQANVSVKYTATELGMINTELGQQWSNSVSLVLVDDNTNTIKNNAYENCSKISSITIPSTITTIPNDSFVGCNLGSINFDTTNNNVFNHVSTTALDSVTYKSTGEYVQGLIIGKIQYTNNTSFENNLSITSVYISKDINDIKENAFAGCNLKSIEIDENNNTYQLVNFEKSNVVIGQTIVEKEIIKTNEKFEFKSVGCLAWGNLDFSVSEYSNCDIADEAFQNCSSITGFTCTNCNIIGKSAFENCTNLKTLNLIGTVAFGQYGTDDAPIQYQINGLTTIGESAFKNCASITNLSLPTSVGVCAHELDQYFQWAKDEEGNYKYVENGLGAIGENAFSGCKNIIYASIPMSYISANNDINLTPSDNNIENEHINHKIDVSTWSKSLTLELQGRGIATNTSINIGADSVLPLGSECIVDEGFSGLTNISSLNIKPNYILVGATTSTIKAGYISVIQQEFISNFEDPLGEQLAETLSVPFAEWYWKYSGDDGTDFDNVFNQYEAWKQLSEQQQQQIKEGIMNEGGMSTKPSLDNDLNSLIAFTTVGDIEKILVSKTSPTFNGCTNLKNIGFDQGISFISDRTFQDCTKLTIIDMPQAYSSLLYLGDKIFEGCSNIIRININWTKGSSLPTIPFPLDSESYLKKPFNMGTGGSSKGDIYFKGSWGNGTNGDATKQEASNILIKLGIPQTWSFNGV